MMAQAHSSRECFDTPCLRHQLMMHASLAATCLRGLLAHTVHCLSLISYCLGTLVQDEPLHTASTKFGSYDGYHDEYTGRFKPSIVMLPFPKDFANCTILVNAHTSSPFLHNGCSCNTNRSAATQARTLKPPQTGQARIGMGTTH